MFRNERKDEVSWSLEEGHLDWTVWLMLRTTDDLGKTVFLLKNVHVKFMSYHESCGYQ